MTVTMPTVTTAQNGPNTATSQTTYFDTYGRPIWSKDADGFLSYTAYDQASGAITKQIQDVDTTQTSDFANLPSGWSTPTGGGLHLKTLYENDNLGRTTKVTYPNGRVDYTVFDDDAHEVRMYSGWDSTNNLPTGPTMVSRENRALGYTETLTMSATPNVSSGRPTGTESISGIQTLSRSVVNAAGQVIATDQYFNLTGVTYSTSSVTLGTEGTNYYRTEYFYDHRGRLKKTLTPTDTIYRTVYDGLGRVVSQWVGTDDTPTTGFWSPTNLTGTNTVKISENEYDSGGVGDSNLTKSTQIPGGSEANRVSQNFYDWRNRLVASKSGVETSESTSLNRFISYSTYDNLSQVTESEVYDGDNVTITSSGGVPQKPSSSLLRAKSTADYDEWGRVYKSSTFGVDPSSGSVSSNALVSQSWFDKRGNLIKSSSPGGTVSKSEFDGVGRGTKQYVTDGGGDSGYTDADDVTSDNVLSQVETTFDGNGNVLLRVSRERFHDETGTGALGTPSSGVKARVSYNAAYYDKGDRLTDSVNVGTNGGSSYTRPGTVPTRSDTVLVNSQTYNAAGWVYETTDARGLINRSTYDNLGRVTQQIENYVDGTPSDADDKTVEYTYDGSSNMLTLKAKLTGGAYQTTEWVYGVTGTIASNELLKEMKYPDTSTGNPASSEKDQFTYNALGQTLTKTDRNGTVHTYAYDILGRIVSDTVSTLGSGVDGGVRRIETAYDTQGNAYLLTSYDAATSGNIVNQVQRQFNGLGQMTREWQSHSGAVNTSTTPSVQYTYSEMASSANHSRLTGMTYPDGYTLTYNYASGLDNTISRLTSISDASHTLESYAYLGFGIIVKRSHAQPSFDTTYIKLTGESDGDAGDKYIGLDRFYRIVDHRSVSGTTNLDRFAYGYDRSGNRLYRENLVNAAFSELYAYDGLNQLISMDRGTLNGTKTGLTGAASRSQDWDFDSLGNWNSVVSDGVTQTRSHNQQNEITSISGATTPTYDANGNLTRDEAGRTFKYDAWNRLVEARDASNNLLVSYRFDALTRRVSETKGSNVRDFYYSSQWQVLEERLNGTTDIRYVWSPIYVDAMILRDRDSDANGSLEERLYVIQDANFNVTALVNTSGVVVERFAQDAFGVVTVYDSDWSVRSGGSTYGWIYGHQGGRFEAFAGQYHFRHRDQSPTMGRWKQMDPIGFAAGDLNWYNGLANNPFRWVDPSGLSTRDAILQSLEPLISLAFQSPTSTLQREEKTKWRKILGIEIGRKIGFTIRGISSFDNCDRCVSVSGYLQFYGQGKFGLLGKESGSNRLLNWIRRRLPQIVGEGNGGGSFKGICCTKGAKKLTGVKTLPVGPYECALQGRAQFTFKAGFRGTLFDVGIVSAYIEIGGAYTRYWDIFNGPETSGANALNIYLRGTFEVDLLLFKRSYTLEGRIGIDVEI
jgi:RHS repeat-associated protein